MRVREMNLPDENGGDLADFAMRSLTDEITIRTTLIRREVASGSKGSTMQQRNAKGEIICMDCAGPISEARLRAIPLAIRCTGCQEAYTPIQKRRFPNFGHAKRR